MSNDKQDGGPAFPVPGEIMIERSPGELYAQSSMGMGPQPGMTLRDYFAAKALHAIIANPDDDWGSPYDVCATAYKYADAMLKARDQQTEQP